MPNDLAADAASGLRARRRCQGIGSDRPFGIDVLFHLASPIAVQLTAVGCLKKPCPGPLGQKWGADISYIWTAEGWLYLAIVLDLYSRRIVGWATSDRLKKGLALNAQRRAVALRSPSVGLIQHADRR